MVFWGDEVVFIIFASSTGKFNIRHEDDGEPCALLKHRTCRSDSVVGRLSGAVTAKTISRAQLM